MALLQSSDFFFLTWVLIKQVGEFIVPEMMGTFLLSVGSAVSMGLRFKKGWFDWC